MSTPPPQDPTQMYPQQPGQPPYQTGYQQPPQKGGSPWPWVAVAVALIVAGVLAALYITGRDDSNKTPQTVDRTQTVQTTITQATTQTQTVTVPTTVTTPDSGGTAAP